MPNHNHTITADGRHGQNSAWAADFYSDWGDMAHEARSKVSSGTGGNAAHNNMPPFLTLIACKKSHKLQQTTQPSTKSLNSRIKSKL
jgi:microcystin-dependent protein